MNEYPIARAYKGCRVQTIYGGTSQVMKEIIGRDIAGRYPEGHPAVGLGTLVEGISDNVVPASPGDVVADQATRENPGLKFVGALDDLQDRGAAVGLLKTHRLTDLADPAGEADAAVDLDGLARDVVGEPGAVGLRHGCLRLGSPVSAVAENGGLPTPRPPNRI
jgi:hypothetical protein